MCRMPACRSATARKKTSKCARWGSPPKFISLPSRIGNWAKELGVLDLERAVKLTGARFAVYWDLGAKLERALANFMLDLHTGESMDTRKYCRHIW